MKLPASSRRRRLLVFLIGVLLASGTFLLMFILNGGALTEHYFYTLVIFCLVVGIAMPAAYAIAVRKEFEEQKKAMRAGEEECPECGCLQTDRVGMFPRDSEDKEHIELKMVCNSCGKSWIRKERYPV